MNYSTVSVPSTFSPSSRPVLIYPIAEMAYKSRATAWPKIAEGLVEIIKRNPGRRVLVHTVSYDLTNYLLSQLSLPPDIANRLLAYTTAKERQRTLDLYLLTPGAVLLAPSLDRGLDLPDDDCRAIVVCKVPFPNLSDKQVSARLYSKNGQLWYSVQTVRSLVQMTGRGMRHKDDYCESYILDRQFISSIWRKYKHLLPKWWTEALVWDAGRLI